MGRGADLRLDCRAGASWARQRELVLHRSCPFCGGTDIAVEPAPPLTDVAHRCVTCSYLWGAHPAEPIVSGPGDLPALLECNIQDIEICIRQLRDEPDLRVIRNDDRQLALDTAEGEVVFDYPFLGGPFRGGAGMCDIRNKLAHQRDQNIPFATLWAPLTDHLSCGIRNGISGEIGVYWGCGYPDVSRRGIVVRFLHDC